MWSPQLHMDTAMHFCTFDSDTQQLRNQPGACQPLCSGHTSVRAPHSSATEPRGARTRGNTLAWDGEPGSRHVTPHPAPRRPPPLALSSSTAGRSRPDPSVHALSWPALSSQACNLRDRGHTSGSQARGSSALGPNLWTSCHATPFQIPLSCCPLSALSAGGPWILMSCPLGSPTESSRRWELRVPRSPEQGADTDGEVEIRERGESSERVRGQGREREKGGDMPPRSGAWGEVKGGERGTGQW